MKFFRSHILLFLILIFGCVLFFYRISDFPEGFEEGEAAHAVNAFSLSKTGKDEYGRPFPLVLESVGDYKLAIFAYWMIPFISLFGLNETGARLASAIPSLISIMTVYATVLLLMRKKRVALLAAFVMTVSCWNLSLARNAYESSLSLMFLSLGTFGFLKSFISANKKWLLMATSAMSLSVLSYYSSWPPVVFCLIIFLWYGMKKIKRRNFGIPLSVSLLIPVLCILLLTNITSGKRLDQINELPEKSIPIVSELIGEDMHEFPMWYSRMTHNKIFAYSLTITNNFFKNLSADFLFLWGDKIDRRFSVPYQGVFMWIMFPFLALGVMYLIKKNIPLLAFTAGCIISVFLASSFSAFGSEMQRTLPALPLFSLVTGLGLYTARKKINSLFFISGISLFFTFNFILFLHLFFWHMNVHNPWSRDYGMKEMVEKTDMLKQKYKKVYVAGNPYLFFYFYHKTDPELIQEQSKLVGNGVNAINHRQRTRIEDIFTMNTPCPLKGKRGILFICSSEKIPDQTRIVDTVYYRDGRVHFVFLEFDPEAPVGNYRGIERLINTDTDSSRILPENFDKDWTTT